MNEEEKIENSIFIHQEKINELEKIIDNIKQSETKKIRFRIETKHWYGFHEPILTKFKHKLNISKEVMITILQEAVNKERDLINKLIDMEIDRRIK